MITKDITYKQFVAHLDKGNRAYMKKPKSWQRVWFWWQSKKDKWFLNKAFDKRSKGKVTTEASSWITAKDMESHLSFMNRLGYKYHIDE